MKVQNMTSPRSGQPVANQYIIEDGNDKFFQSYNSIIAVKRFGKYPRTMLDERYWNYSVTTGKYRNQFLGEGIADTRKKIESGEYQLNDLN